MRPLVIDDKVRQDIADAIVKARQHPRTLEFMKKNALPHRAILNIEDRPEGLETIPGIEVNIPFGFRCGISFEEQPRVGLCRHLSISIPKPGQLPNPHAIEMIAQAFGVQFPPPAEAGAWWLEEYVPGYHAVCIVQKDFPQ